ncbi:MAG: PH domain-containing protein [Verrucomicrobiota bacterium]
MSLVQGLLGNVTEMPLEEAKNEFGAILIDGEEIQKGYVLIRDMLVFTNFRIISLDKQGVTGKKQNLTTITYKSIRKFSKVSAGIMDLNAELYVYVKGDPSPHVFQFSKDLDINEVYKFLSYYVIASG